MLERETLTHGAETGMSARSGGRRLGAIRRQSGVRRSDVRRRVNVTQAAWGYLFIAPVGVGLAVFYLWPVIQTFYFSFTTFGPFGGHTWSGLANYLQLFHDPTFLRATLNTFEYVGIALIGIPLGVLFAALINRPGLRGRTVYRTLYFLPVVTMPTAVGLVWGSIYNGQFGLINAILARIGINGPDWTSDPQTALVAVGVVTLWSTLGYNIIILSAGLQNIPSEYYEASTLEGANWFSQLIYITLPLLTPTIFFVSVISIIGSFQLFDLVYVMIGQGNPALPSARTIVYLFYQTGFIDNNRGYAAAIAFALLVLIVIFTIVQFRLQNRWVHYE